MLWLIETCVKAIDDSGLYDDPVMVKLPYTPTLEDLIEIEQELNSLYDNLGAILANISDLRYIYIHRH